MDATLLTLGILLLLVGLIGQVKAKEIEIGTTNPFVRTILAIIGVVFVYLALSKSYLTNTSASPTPISAPASTLALPTPIPCSFNSKSRRPFPPSNLAGSIAIPANCDTGIIFGRQSPSTTEGTIQQEIPSGSDLWLFVYAPDGKYYPQCNNLTTTKAECTISGGFSGEWSMRTYLADECKPYYLVLVSTNNDVTNFLLSTMNIWESSGSYVGLTRDELKPYEIKELYSVQVETGLCATQTPTP